MTHDDNCAFDIRLGIRIPLRDGKFLGATAFVPRKPVGLTPAICMLTPYIADNYHERGTYFAARGFAFVAIDVRGRGDSDGTFDGFNPNGDDGYDAIEWIAAQDFCDGQVAMWGGSYGGFIQWVAAKTKPPHLRTIVPAASACLGVDVPWRNAISYQYLAQWFAYTRGKALQSNLFADSQFWRALWRRRFESGASFESLSDEVGGSAVLRDLIASGAHDHDRARLTGDDYLKIDIPVLTITGSYDDDQFGALAYYRAHLAAGARQHDLVIGPWDHFGTRTPKAQVGGVKFGPASLIDLPRLHVDWYNYVMRGAPRPSFLADRVAVYVMGAEVWRYGPTLSSFTKLELPLFLTSQSNASRIFGGGDLTESAHSGSPDHYVYDPRDVSTAALECTIDPEDPAEQAMVFAFDGKQLVYHSATFAEGLEIAGCFRLDAWIGIDQPDTDISVKVFEIDARGGSVLLATDQVRCRHRESDNIERLVEDDAPRLYTFNRFNFTARRIGAGSRLRLTVGPINSIYTQKNYNAAKPVVEQTMADARPVCVRLFHDHHHQSVLFVPIGGDTASTHVVGE